MRAFVEEYEKNTDGKIDIIEVRTLLCGIKNFKGPKAYIYLARFISDTCVHLCTQQFALHDHDQSLFIPYKLTGCRC